MGNVTMTTDSGCRYRRTQSVSYPEAESLRRSAAKRAAEVEARRRFLEKDHALRAEVYGPVLRTMTPEARAAVAERAASERKAFEEGAKTAKAAPPHVLPEVIHTQRKAQLATPPYDDAWKDPGSSGFVDADKAAGWISTSLAANGAQYAAAGLLLVIVPAAFSDSLVVISVMQFRGSCSASTYWYGSAGVSGYGEIQVSAFDDQLFHLPQFDQQQQTPTYSALANGPGQHAGFPINFSWDPIVRLQNGTFYELWMTLTNYAEASGDAQALSSLAVTIPHVFILESQ
jgi:hypothetical protein